ncbi:MAG TPA: hypothetical protein VLG72_08750 [Nitrospirota bacterium]|nr:hypothetical protein [Nitrospirota bacterium]
MAVAKIDRTVQADARCIRELEDERDQESRHKEHDQQRYASIVPRHWQFLFFPSDGIRHHG